MEAGLPEAVSCAAGEGDVQAVTAWLHEGGGVDESATDAPGASAAGAKGDSLKVISTQSLTLTL